MEDATACQAPHALRVLQLQRRKAHDIEWLQDVGRVRWHAERQDLMLTAVVLEVLVEMAFMTIEDEQPSDPHLTRLCVRIKMLQPLKTKRVVCLAVL